MVSASAFFYKEVRELEMGVFSKCQIALDLDTSVPFKRKAAIKRQIIDNDGIISYIVSKKVTLSLQCIFRTESLCEVDYIAQARNDKSHCSQYQFCVTFKVCWHETDWLL